jgi:N-acetylmuramoyl-L-alanine amidase
MFLKTFFRTIGIAAGLLLAGCESMHHHRGPPRPAMPAYTQLPMSVRPSPNFGPRRPNFIVLHHTADNSAEDSLRTLTTRRFEVSSHYLIGRDGTLYYLVDEMARAWHAGEGYWGGTTDVNSASIGIELDNNGREPFAEPMISTLLLLLDELKTRYKIPTANFLAHGDIIPGRKVDPSRLFPWKRLAERGFGLWCESPTNGAAPAGVSDALLLTAFGYEVTNLRATAAAFRRRYLGTETEEPLTSNERAMLQCLIDRKRER